MHGQALKRRSGQFSRGHKHDRIHSMLTSWASHILLALGSSEGQGYTIAFLNDYSGLPPHSLIPKGVEFTSPDDIAVENWLEHTSRVIRANTLRKYIHRQPISKDQSYQLLKDASKYLYG